MASDISMLPAVPVVAPREQLPTVSDVKEWTEKELFSFIQSQNILREGKDRRTFTKAKIDGDMFLTDGDTTHFWHVECDLPAGPSKRLASLVKKIKGVGDEQSQGNAFLCFSDVAGLG
jgi:hypothetical protein